MAATQTIKKPAGTGRSSGRCHTIGIAGIEVVQAPDTIRTVVGSCIAIALYDRVKKIGGMAHVILPNSQQGTGDPGKFADTAVDLLRTALLAEGAEAEHLTCKIAGGATMFGPQTGPGLGTRNADAVKERLTHQGVRLAGSDLGGRKGRKVSLDPATGEVQVEVIGEASREI